MAYSTVLQVVQRSGLGIRIIDENVGTGDNSNLSFDLDHINVIGGSYTLSYAASGSNSFSALTDVTHYALDLESGRILLTSAGKTSLATNILYASYSYTDSFSSSVVSDFIGVADAEINKITGRKWDSASAVIEYQSGRRSSSYPTTDNPYMNDWDAPDFILLSNIPVSQVDAAYFLSNALSVQKFYNYDDSGVSYTDYTTEINSTTETPFTLFASTPASNDVVYIGSSEVFLGLDIVLNILGTGSPVIDWEYWNGSAWTDLTETDVTSGASVFTASGKFTFTYPYGWTETSVNGYSAFWIRGVLTTGYTIAPKVSTMTLSDAVNTVIEKRDYAFTTDGKLSFLSNRIIDGTNNIRIDYKYGLSSTPAYITELSVLLAGLNAFIYLTGGSFDNATSYTLGSKAVTIGEQYVNIREVFSQFQKRITELLDMLGRRMYVTAI